MVPLSWSSASVQPYPSSVPCRRSWFSLLSMNRIGVVRLGPTIAWCATSMRRKLGAPRSSGRPFVQSSPGAHSMPSTGAQINSLEPSKSPADAVPAVSHASAATRGSKRVIWPPLLEGVAAAFHAGAVAAVICLDQLLLLGLRLLLLRRLLLAGATAARHRAHHRPHACAPAGVSRDRPDRRPARRPAGGTPQALTATDRRARLLWGRVGGHRRGVNARRLLGPGGALGVILALLLRALAFCGVDDRRLCLRGADQREHCDPHT